MAKCRQLHQENEELGKVVSSGRQAKLEGDLALQKKITEELKKTESEAEDILTELDEDVEGLQSTIYLLQQQLQEKTEQKNDFEAKYKQLLEQSSLSQVHDSKEVYQDTQQEDTVENKRTCRDSIDMKVEPDLRTSIRSQDVPEQMEHSDINGKDKNTNSGGFPDSNDADISKQSCHAEEDLHLNGSSVSSRETADEEITTNRLTTQDPVNKSVKKRTAVSRDNTVEDIRRSKRTKLQEDERTTSLANGIDEVGDD